MRPAPPVADPRRCPEPPQRPSRARTPEIPRSVCGIDVAGPGKDETTVAVRSGGHILETHAFADADPRGRVAQVLSKWQRTGRLNWVLVDVIGIGYNFALHLADLGFPVVQFNAGHRPIDIERFTNLKAEAYWQLREHMESGAISGLNDLETEAQLSGILYRPTSSGRTDERENVSSGKTRSVLVNPLSRGKGDQHGAGLASGSIDVG